VPIYAYECLECKQRFEKVRPTEARDVAPQCPACGAFLVQRTLGSISVRFVGEGWTTPPTQRELSTERMDL
jgi:putative FmdB family regulatory protein